MFLAIDAGNSNVVFALFDPKTEKWTNQFRLETKTELLISQLTKKVPLYFLEHSISPSDISEIGFSTVVPEVQGPIQEFCEKFLAKPPTKSALKAINHFPSARFVPKK